MLMHRGLFTYVFIGATPPAPPGGLGETLPLGDVLPLGGNRPVYPNSPGKVGPIIGGVGVRYCRSREMRSRSRSLSRPLPSCSMSLSPHAKPPNPDRSPRELNGVILLLIRKNFTSVLLKSVSDAFFARCWVDSCCGVSDPERGCINT